MLCYAMLLQRAGHATELARTLPTAGYQGIVILGGDGSLFEAANGMLARPEAERIPLALVPGGSGNSVLRDLVSFAHPRGLATTRSPPTLAGSDWPHRGRRA